MHFSDSELRGGHVWLTPVQRADLPELTRAALIEPAIFQHIPYAMRTAADIATWLDWVLTRRERGQAITYATRLAASGEIVGSTSLTLSDDALPTVEIGFTWIVPACQRTPVNTEAKLLQLTHCFEQLGCLRVELKTDVRNLRSRAAIARIGGREEGVLRAHRRRLDGSLRDSVLFSILASEWPDVRAALQRKLGARTR